MNKCSSCDKNFSDGVVCNGCKKHLDFTCANISEGGYRKLGAERRAAWRCPFCRGASPGARANTEPITLETLLAELRDVKRQLSSLPGLVDEIHDIKAEITDLKNSCEFFNAKFEDLHGRLIAVEQKCSDMDRACENISQAEKDITNLRDELQARDQLCRLNNIEIKGIPLKKNENLYSIVVNLGSKVGYTVSKSQINYIARVPIPNSKDKGIVVSFLNRFTKEDFVAAARAMKTIYAGELGFGENQTRVYVNDHLTPYMKALLTKAKSLAKLKDYQYIWVKYAKIHLRKNDTSHITIIRKESDLNKIA